MPHGVGHIGLAADPLVAEQLAVLGHRAPEKREQQAPALLRIVGPIFVAKLRYRRPTSARLIIHQLWIRAAENFLPPHAIADDQHDIAGMRRPCRVCNEQNETASQQISQ
jgi:hypothetical protein